MDRRLIYLLTHVLLIPLYYFLLMVLLRPEGLIDMLGIKSFIEGVLVITGLMMFTLAFTRTIYFFAGDMLASVRALMLFWPAGEIVIISLAVALCLDFELKACLTLTIHLLAVLALPYCLLSVVAQMYCLRKKHEELLMADKMRFYDKKGILRIVLKPESVVYIQADNNDVRINYLDNGKTCQFSMRNSLQAVDELCQYHGFIKVHRSYLVNPDHVTWLGRGDRNEVYAILDRQDMPHIPVTKRYYARIEEKVLIQNRP